MALEAFNNALNFDLSDEDKILILQRKGMLLKMMSQGAESIETLQLVFDVPTATKSDYSEAYVHIADSQTMMGQVSEALVSLQKALDANPNNLEVYYPMVQACKEVKCKTVEGWGTFVMEIVNAITNSKNPSTKKKSKRSQKINVDFLDDDDEDVRSSTESSSLYWALYEAGLKAGSFHPFLNVSILGQKIFLLLGLIWRKRIRLN